jgi:NAD(P)-dependent dehydrogenase (short-subunit alcohol dehydrogenase family)
VTGPLDGRVVLVTGAADGVGRGIAAACGAAGAQVVATGRREAAAPVANGIWLRCDVTSQADVSGAVAAAVERFGRLDVIVHNATSGRSSQPVALAGATAEEWDDHVSVSLRGAYHCAVAGFAALRDSGRGRYVICTSPAGMEGSATLPLYGGVKAAVRGLMKSLALEWGPSGINVNCLAPLAMTPAMADAFAANPSLEGRLADRVPLGRLGDPESDVGPAAVFLAGDASRYVTGQTLCVDGGRYTGL